MQTGWTKTWPSEDGFYWIKTKYLQDIEVIYLDRGLILLAGKSRVYGKIEAPNVEFFYPKLECPN